MSGFRFEANSNGVFEAFRKAPQTLVVVDQALDAGATLIGREAVRLAPAADGDLRRGIVKSRLANLVYQITSTAYHAGIVEEGTGIYGPLRRELGKQTLPDAGISRLAAWIRRKGITPRDPKIKPEELPWLIARKIARDGTRAQPYMAPALESQRSRVNQLVQDAVIRGMKDAGFSVAGL